MRFERLGFVCFLSSESAQFTACELQDVQLPRPTSKITLLRLILHSCHQTRTNLFSQVGLASVMMLGTQKDTNVLLPMIPSPRKSPVKGAASPRRRLYDTTSFKTTQEIGMKPPRATEIWVQDSHELKTPEQICAGIQLGKQLAQFTGHEKLVQPWVSLGQEANRLINVLGRSAHLSRAQPGTETTSRGNVLECFADLENRRRRQEEILSLLMSSSSRPEYDQNSLRELKTPNVVKRFQISAWQERETLPWQLAHRSQKLVESGERRSRQTCQLEITDVEALEVLVAALDDSNVQVFAAGCAFFRALLATLRYFQDTVASKTDVSIFVWGKIQLYLQLTSCIYTCCCVLAC